MANTKFYGWKALIGAMMVYVVLSGCVFYSFGVFLPVICDDMGWSRGAVSATYTVHLFVLGILGPVVGLSITRFGARKNIIIGNLITSLGLLSMAFVQEIWQLYLIFGVVLGTGTSFGGFIPATTVASNWFVKRRSLALSLVISSGGVSGFIFPLILGGIIPVIGWRFSFVFLGVVYAAFGVIVAGILVRNRPEDMGQVPDGETALVTVAGSAAQPAPSRVYETSINWSVGDAKRTRSFWLILVFFASSIFTLGILNTNSVAYLQDIGFSPMMAASGLSILVGMSTIGKFLAGPLGARFQIRHLGAVFLGTYIIGIFILMNVESLPLIYLYAIISGISYGGTVVFTPAILGSYYGRTDFQKFMGWAVLFSNTIAAISPVLAGYVFDITGNYDIAFSIAIGFLAVGIVCCLLARPPRPKQVLTG